MKFHYSLWVSASAALAIALLPGVSQAKGGSYSKEQSGVSASKAEDYSKDQKVVQKVEQSLSDRGYKVGKIDGKLDGDSKSSLKKFQRTQGFEATGKLDRETLSALGVEPSEMAGASGSEYGTSEQSGQSGENPSMEPTPAETPFEQPGQAPGQSNEDVAPFPSDVGRSNESGGMTH